MVAARPYSEGWAPRVLVAVAIVAIFATVAGYVATIRDQGGPGPSDVLTVPFVSAYLLSMAVILAISLIERRLITSLRPALGGRRRPDWRRSACCPLLRSGWPS